MGEVSVQAARGVDLDLSARGVVVLLGPSGRGKSTLPNILSGLDSPSGGQVISEDIRQIKPGDRFPNRARHCVLWMDGLALTKIPSSRPWATATGRRNGWRPCRVSSSLRRFPE
ncbi:ATP-binding cassette domain-containing protein [Thiocystis violacea]|uniref:ATP-binding cassette domain-containing protein n=1 Tax=Thiocystis violacea TaxID=13725 RepID=UPI001905522E|nr:hypothetical protein [Thiocystis violacea]